MYRHLPCLGRDQWLEVLRACISVSDGAYDQPQCYPFFLGSLFFKERVLVTLQRVVTLFSLPSKPVGVVSLSILQMKKLRLMGVNWLELRSQLRQAQCKRLAT